MAKTSTSSLLLASCIAVSGGLGCDALTGPGYPGEPVLTLRGEVSSALGADQGNVDDGVTVAIIWVAGDVAEGIFPVAETTEVEGNFPANFSLDVYHPPEEASLVTLDNGARIGIGFIVALPADGATGDQVDIASMLGVTNQHAIIYIPTDSDLAPAIDAEGKLHNAQVGFNLFDVAATTPGFEACVTDAVTAIDSCHADCTANCDPDSAADPGCDLCREPCNALSAGLDTCDQLVDSVVPTSTGLELSLDADAVAISAVFSIFAAQASAADSSDEPAAE